MCQLELPSIYQVSDFLTLSEDVAIQLTQMPFEMREHVSSQIADFGELALGLALLGQSMFCSSRLKRRDVHGLEHLADFLIGRHSGIRAMWSHVVFDVTKGSRGLLVITELHLHH